MFDVLIVDDMADGRALLAACCEALHLRCHAVSSGGEALEWLEVNYAHVVLLDLAMPVLTGLDVADAIRKNERAHGTEAVQIVFYTGNGDINDPVRENMKRNSVRSFYVKGKDSALDMAIEISQWIKEKRHET